MAYTREPISGSTHGRGIKLTGTATGSSVAIHTGQASAVLSDVVTLYAMNSDTVVRRVSLEWGGTTSPDDIIVMDLPPKSGLVPLVVDLLIRNSLPCKAWADAANVVMIFGFVNTEA